MTAHAKLSASGAHRWMVCPASVALEAKLPESSTTFANEGSAAHAVAAAALTDDKDVRGFVGWWYDPSTDALSATPLVDVENAVEITEEFVDPVQQYVDTVRSIAKDADEVLIETRVNFDQWVPGAFGTADAVVIKEDHATIIDMKYGKGVKVDAEGNSQAQLYALGALQELDYLYDVKRFDIVIHQPRLDHVSEWSITRDELLKFGELVKKRAAETESPNAEAVPGESQCRFCRAKATCKALAKVALDTARLDFNDAQPDAAELTVDEVADVLNREPLITGFLKAVRAHATEEAKRGRKVPGFKLVEGRSVRRWSDESAAITALKKMRVKKADMVEEKLISPPKAQKLLGARFSRVEQLVFKPPGALTLAPASDKRRAVSTAQDDFKEEITQ